MEANFTFPFSETEGMKVILSNRSNPRVLLSQSKSISRDIFSNTSNPNPMKKDWPPLKECPQFREGLMHAAEYRYPWEEDGYPFDFDAFYPPLPDGPPWLRKLLVLTKDMARLPKVEPFVDKDCPICNPHVDLGTKLNVYTYPEIDEHPVLNMDPIPNPFHILAHFYGPGTYEERPRLVTPQELESTKKFLKDLRATRGYNVDTTPHEGLVYSIHFYNHNLKGELRVNGKKWKDHVEDALYCVIDYINSKTDKSYKLVEVLKVVTTTPMCLVTFSAVASPAAQETFIASLDLLLPSSEKITFFKGFKNPSILECLLLPDYNAPCETKLHPMYSGEEEEEEFSTVGACLFDSRQSFV